jgi:AcrR family transcriptional regulator
MSSRARPPAVRQPLNRGRTRQKLRTRRQILAAATALLAAGKTPTVEQTADAAGVSRRTAYRYFPAQAKLLSEAALEGLRGPMEAMLQAAPVGPEPRDVEARVTTMIEGMQSMALQNEALLRTMIHQTVLERSPAGQPRRGTRRIDWIELAVQPLRERLGARGWRLLVSGLALCGGIEALLVLRDIRGLRPAEATATSAWAARALLRQALVDAAAGARQAAKRGPSRASR